MKPAKIVLAVLDAFPFGAVQADRTPTLYGLAQEGVSVSVLDRQRPGQEASWAGAGMLPPGVLSRARGRGPTDGEPRAAGATGLAEIPIEFIRPGPFQPRKDMDPDALAELAASIRAQGIMQPIVVRVAEQADPGAAPGSGDRYEIIAGERRWRAAQQAGLHAVPAVIREVTDEAGFAQAIAEVMTDLASITQVHLRLVPLARVSVYLLVSSRLSTAPSVTSMRRSHLTHMLPSQPGTTRRTG